MYTIQASDEFLLPRKIIAGSLTDRLKSLKVGDHYLLVGRTIRYASGAAGRAAKAMPGRKFRCRTKRGGKDVKIYRTL